MEKMSFTVPENYKYPRVAAIGKMAEHPLYLDIFYLCGVFQSLQNLGLIEECCELSDSLMPLWWDLYWLHHKTPLSKIQEIIDQTGWEPAFKDKAFRMYQEYIKPDFFDRLTCK